MTPSRWEYKNKSSKKKGRANTLNNTGAGLHNGPLSVNTWGLNKHQLSEIMSHLRQLVCGPDNQELCVKVSPIGKQIALS